MSSLRCLLVLCSVVYVMSNSEDFNVDQMGGNCVCRYERIQSSYEVDCTNKNLIEVPDCQWENVTRLRLSENNISSISRETFQRFIHLQILELNENLLSYLPDLNITLKNLNELNLNNNKFTTIPLKALLRMPNLKSLHMSHNDIEEIDGSLELKNLTELELDFNHITKIPHFAPEGMPSLKILKLRDNFVKEIPKNALENLIKLETLSLRENKLEYIHPKFMGNNTESLKNIDFSHNQQLRSIPYGSIRNLNYLKRLRLFGTNITEIPDLAFQNLKLLEEIELLSIHEKKHLKIGLKAFAYLPALQNLVLPSCNLEHFPNLTGTHSLKNVLLEGNKIKTLPENICETLPFLEDLDLNRNKLKALPSLSKCKELIILKIDFNQIKSFGDSLHGAEKLLDITAKNNVIASIGEYDFKGLTNLEYLNLQENKISHIHKNAFSYFQRLKTLDLADNNFPNLPTLGLHTVTSLSVKGNSMLTQFPSLRYIPNIRTLEVHYPYHCCSFLKKEKFKRKPLNNSQDFANLDDFTGSHVSWTWLSNGSEHPFDDSAASGNYKQETVKEETTNQETTSDEIECIPEPDPFFPCEDLMGDWVLRCGVWIVFVLALCGNATVIIVILASHTKMDVSRFLISNLAFADLFMGIYLGFLAVVDISTLGNFQAYGIEWQMSSGCRTAGFLAILSSELSVFTLTVITLERYIAIKNAIRVNRKLQLKTAIFVMIFGWVFAIVTAMLPLLQVNNYGKFSVCLPFEVGDMGSIAFLVCLLGLNAVAFIVIFFCYILMYCSIRGSNAWNASDFRVAKRMALLVFTDFACWAPIVFLSLTAAFGTTFVTLSQAKIFTVFVFPLNSCANPFLYAIFTSHFKKDLLAICRKVEDKYPFLKITKQRISFSRRSSCSGAISDNPNLYLRVRRFSLPVFPKGFSNSITTNARGSDSSNSNKNSSETNAISHDCSEQLLTERETSV